MKQTSLLRVDFRAIALPFALVLMTSGVYMNRFAGQALPGSDMRL